MRRHDVKHVVTFMELEWQQRRLLKDLDRIFEYGGELIGRLERRKEGQGDLVYHLEGWRSSQSENTNITHSIGEDLVRPLQEMGYIHVAPMGADRYRFSITDAGSDALDSAVR